MKCKWTARTPVTIRERFFILSDSGPCLLSLPQVEFVGWLKLSERYRHSRLRTQYGIALCLPTQVQPGRDPEPRSQRARVARHVRDEGARRAEAGGSRLRRHPDHRLAGSRSGISTVCPILNTSDNRRLSSFEFCCGVDCRRSQVDFMPNFNELG